MQCLVHWYKVIFFVATLTRPFVGILADSFKFGEGIFLIASKNTVAALLLLQTGTFLVLVPISIQGYLYGFLMSMSLIFIVFAAAECVASILARDVFGAENSSLVFAAGGAIGFGIGEYIPTKTIQKRVTELIRAHYRKH